MDRSLRDKKLKLDKLAAYKRARGGGTRVFEVDFLFSYSPVPKHAHDASGRGWYDLRWGHGRSVQEHSQRTSSTRWLRCWWWGWRIYGQRDGWVDRRGQERWIWGWRGDQERYLRALLYLKYILNILLAKKMKGKAATVKSSKPAPAFARPVVPSISAYRPIVSAEQEEDSSLQVLCALDNSATSPLPKKKVNENLVNGRLRPIYRQRV